MTRLERLAFETGCRSVDQRRGCVEPERSAAVINGSGSDPFQRVRIANKAKVILVAVFVDEKIINNQHAVKRFAHIGDSQRIAAGQAMLMDGEVVFLLQRLHDIPRADQLGFRRDEVFTYAERIIILIRYAVFHMRNAETVHQDACKNFVIRLLLCCTAAAFEKASLAIQNGPFLFQPSIGRVVR